MQRTSQKLVGLGRMSVPMNGLNMYADLGYEVAIIGFKSFDHEALRRSRTYHLCSSAVFGRRITEEDF